jgi:general secretion pathway protein D
MLIPVRLRYLLYGLLFICLPVSSEEVTLNLQDADINSLIDLVSKVTHKVFIVDPRVKGQIKVVASHPMDNNQLYEVFLSILSVNGFTAVPSGSVIKIVPQNVAKSENTPVLENNATLQGDALVTQVIQVQNISAPQLIPLLRPLIAQHGHIVAYPANNTIIVSDSADNINRLVKIIHRVDLPENDDVEVLVLQHASATEVVRVLTTLEQKNAAAAAASGKTVTTSIVADERTNSVLISGDKTSRLRLRTLITHLDTPLKSIGNTQVVYLRYAQAKQLAEVLRGVNENATMIRPKTETKTEKPVATTAPTETIKTNIQADETTNSLVITASPAEWQNLQAVIRQLDVRRAQVLVEAIIAEVSTDVTEKLGVQWILDGTANGIAPIGLSNFNNVGLGILDLATSAMQIRDNRTTNIPNVGSGAFLGLGRIGSNTLNFGVLLQALSADTNANVLSTPSLLTLDNQEAEIVVGQNVPLLTGQYTATGTASNVTNPFQTIQREDIGVKLKVTPHINEGNAVKLNIEQEVSSISSDSVAGFIINKRTIKTTVIVEDGNLIVLGGLIDEDLQQTAQKVPGLGDIPILGALFRSQSTKKVKRNLMVFLRPLILRDATDETFISHNKYSYMQTRQLEQKMQGLPLLPSDQVPVLPNLNDFLVILPK